MANYNYSAISSQGINGPSSRHLIADLGMALFVELYDNASTGIPQGAVGGTYPLVALAAVPAGFSVIGHNAFTAGFTPDRSSGADWATLDRSVLDMDAYVRVSVTDPTFTASSPSPVLANWATQFGGTVQED